VAIVILPSRVRATYPMSDHECRVALRGDALLTNPRINKGTAFSIEERKAFGLTGRLPYRVNSLDEQCVRAYDQLNAHESPIRKNSFLQSLKDQNWVLYYALLSRNLRELIPIIYTPTEVCCFLLDGCVLRFYGCRLKPSRITRISSEGVKVFT
jgi:hypothetical protein